MALDIAVEIALLDAINADPDCISAQVAAHRGEHFGILVLHRGLGVGLWSWQGGVLGFQSLATQDAIRTADDVDNAIAMTLEMAAALRWHP